MGVSTYNPETGEWTVESGKDDYNRSSDDRYGPEIGNRQPERPQIDPRGIVQPGLQIITPTIEKKRDPCVHPCFGVVWRGTRGGRGWGAFGGWVTRS